MSVAEEYGFNFESEPCWDLKFIPDHTTKNGTFVPAGVYPCRKCLPCLKRRRDEWVRRLCEELKDHDLNSFVTLTVDNDHMVYTCDDPRTGEVFYDQDCIPQVWKPHLLKFHADMRKRYQQGFFIRHFHSPFDGHDHEIRIDLVGSMPKYYCTAELGPLHNRPHYHCVYYGVEDIYTFTLLVQELWPHGFVTVYPALDGAAGYISKYLVKDVTADNLDQWQGQLPPFSLMSKGLGKSYIERMKVYHNADPEHRQFYQSHGQRGKLSRYYREKIFSEEFRTAHANVYQDKLREIYMRYKNLEKDHPARYKRLMQEKQKYIKDQIYAENWHQKKHSIIK